VEVKFEASEAQFDYLIRIDLVIEALAAFFNNSLHIGSLTTDHSTCNLEFSLIIYLDIVSASVLDSFFSVVFFRVFSFEIVVLSTPTKRLLLIETKLWVEGRS